MNNYFKKPSQSFIFFTNLPSESFFEFCSWRLTSILQTILHPTLPARSNRRYTQLLIMLYALKLTPLVNFINILQKKIANPNWRYIKSVPKKLWFEKAAWKMLIKWKPANPDKPRRIHIRWEWSWLGRLQAKIFFPRNEHFGWRWNVDLRSITWTFYKQLLHGYSCIKNYKV